MDIMVQQQCCALMMHSFAQCERERCVCGGVGNKLRYSRWYRAENTKVPPRTHCLVYMGKCLRFGDGYADWEMGTGDDALGVEWTLCVLKSRQVRTQFKPGTRYPLRRGDDPLRIQD